MRRIIWQYWETQGKKPAFIDGLLDIARKNAGVPVIQVTPDTLAHYLPDLPPHVHAIQELAHKADMIRVLLLSNHGGMWLDSDAIVLRDLNPLFDLLAEHEFVGFNDHAPRRRTPAPKARVNCFLSRPQGQIVSEWARLQHAKFPRTTYEWEEVGSDILHPLCLAHPNLVKVLPFETICPVPWYDVDEFSSRRHSPRKITRMLETCIMVMMSNQALGTRNPEIQNQTVAELSQGDTLLSHFIKRALDANYRPPTGYGHLRHYASRAGISKAIRSVSRYLKQPL